MKHIKVTPADDDEVVFAGYADSPAESSVSAAKPDGYRETTLEDLEHVPMPLAQKIVIVAAVVCIIGALVYYFTAMR